MEAPLIVLYVLAFGDLWANAFVLVVLNMILHCNNSLRAQCNSYKDSLMKG